MFAHPISTRVETNRFDGYVPPEHQVKLDVIRASCVVVTGLHTDNIDQRKDDSIRRCTRFAAYLDISEEYKKGFFPKNGLAFALKIKGNRDELVHRLLAYRDEEKERSRRVNEDERPRSRWLGKQPPIPWRSEEKMKKRKGKAVGKKSLLRYVVSVNNGEEEEPEVKRTDSFDLLCEEMKELKHSGYS